MKIAEWLYRGAPMPRWMSALFRAIGFVNLGLSAVGLYYLLDSVIFWLANPNRNPRNPYFYYAFYPMAAINLTLITLLSLTSFDLLGLRLDVVKRYTWFVLAVVGYEILVALCWTIPGPFGMSVAGASGVGNMGIAPFEFALFYVPYGYPVVSLVALRLACRSLARRSQVSS
jgi:hypothetical protein